MRKLVAAVSLSLCASGAMAADYGVGVSAKSDDGWVYVPIDISPGFRLEPSLRYSKIEETSNYSSGGYLVNETENWEFGVGAFGLKKVTDAASIYYGARVAYIDSTDLSQSSYGIETSIDGYRFAPTVGFEYRFGQHFSVGGEASYNVVDLDGETTSPFSDTAVERKSQGTQTYLIFRYMF